MINTTLLEEVINDQLDNFKRKDIGITRNVDFEKYIRTKQITVISGIRRSGKSTLLTQFASRYKNYYYINFDDERLINFTVDDFHSLMLVFHKLYQADVIFLDEVQNIEGWERFIRRIHDEEYKIFLTGSNARLLSSELATHLTGRYVKIELYPFSFREYLSFHGIDYDIKTSKKKAIVLRYFDKYLRGGGFPEFVKSEENEFLKRVYDDILYRDILVRFRIKEAQAFKNLSAFLFTNFTKEASYNSLKNSLGFKSLTSVKNYIGFMEESFLIFELARYDHSLKKQITSGRKIYVIDNGLRNIVSFYFSEDEGRLLENLVFIELKRRQKEVFYFREKGECDFIIRTGNKITEAIQVSLGLRTGANEEREIAGIREALEYFKLKSGTILTKHKNDIIRENGLTIKLIPVWEWLLGGVE